MRKIDELPDIDFIDGATMEDVKADLINDFKSEYKRITGKEAYLSKASPYMMIINAVALQIYQLMQYTDNAGKMNLTKYSRGKYLDNLVAFKGLIRKEAEKAKTVIRFEISSPLDFALSIPKGTRVTNGNNIFFETEQYAEIKPGETFNEVAALCTEKGIKGNGIGEGELNIIINPIPYVVAVRNMKITSGGREDESDEELAERYLDVSEIYSTTGSEGAYKYFAKQADKDVEDVIVKSKEDATVELIISKKGSGLPDERLLTRVKEYLEDGNRKPLTDKIQVKAPEKLEYNVKLTYYISSDKKALVDKIKSDVDTAIRTFNLWQTEKIGRDINPSYLTSKIMETGIKRVDIVAPTYTITPVESIPVVKNIDAIYGGLEDD